MNINIFKITCPSYDCSLKISLKEAYYPVILEKLIDILTHECCTR